MKKCRDFEFLNYWLFLVFTVLFVFTAGVMLASCVTTGSCTVEGRTKTGGIGAAEDRSGKCGSGAAEDFSGKRGCVKGSSKKTASPYRLSFDGEAFGEGETGFEFSFRNLSETDVLGFNVLLSVSNEEGQPVLMEGEEEFVYEKDVGPGEEAAFFLDFEERLLFEAEGTCGVDYFYVSEIRYSDGKNWQDPFGRFCR